MKHEDQRKEKVKNEDNEYDDESEGEEILGVVDTYKQLVRQIHLTSEYGTSENGICTVNVS